MQRSLLRLATAVALIWLACASAVAPAHARQPVTVTLDAKKAIDSDPTGAVFEPVVSVKPGDRFFYSIFVSPKNDPATPITLTLTIDSRLAWFTTGGDGACTFNNGGSTVLTCRDAWQDPNQPKLTDVWLWVNVLPSCNAAPLVATVVTADDRKSITIPYVTSACRVALPLIVRSK